MVTAADGAENYYTLENNEIRSEGMEQARAQDRMTRNVRERLIVVLLKIKIILLERFEK